MTPAIATSVRCFRRADAVGSRGRRGAWVFTRPEYDGRGAFYHGSRDEIQAPRWTPQDLMGGDALVEAEEITPEQVLEELANWPEARDHARKVFERHPK